MTNTPYSKNSYKRLHLFTEQDLQEALDFTDEDLQANRDGYMTKRQRRKLKTDFRKMAVLFGGLAILFSVFISIPTTTSDWFNTTVLMLCDGSIFLLVAFLIYMIYSVRQNTQADLYKGDVEEIAGRLSFREEKGSRGSIHCYVIVAEKEFSISHIAYSVLKGLSGEDEYVIYFTPNSKKILSAEKLNPDEK